jgi:hypothetical protein
MTLLHGEQEARLTEAGARFGLPLVGISVSLPRRQLDRRLEPYGFRHDGIPLFLRGVHCTLSSSRLVSLKGNKTRKP